MIQLTATDADDPTYGNSARVVYSILEGQPYFSVDAKTGKASQMLQNLTTSVLWATNKYIMICMDGDRWLDKGRVHVGNVI